MSTITTEWSSGPRCGVNNCRSRLWRTDRGQRICQNGHVRHGDIEMADDEEEFYGGGGRRMTQASQAVAVDDSDTRRLYKGPEARKLLLMAIQIVLREQVRWLMDRQFVSEEIEPLVKALFAIYSEHAVLAADRGPSKGPDGHPVVRIRMPSTVTICLLACSLMRVPIYGYDFVRWIKYDKFPYLMAHNIVPNEITARMGQGLLLPLVSSEILSTNRIHHESKELIKLFERTARIDFPAIAVHPLLYKMVRDLFLPPEIYPGVLQILADRYRQNYGLFRVEGIKSLEIIVFSAVFVCTKLFYGLDNTQRRPTNRDEPAATAVDWDLWASMVRRTWLEEETFATTNPQSAVHWNRAKIGRFLKWLDTQYYPPDDQIDYEMPESKVTTRNIFRQFPREQSNLDEELDTVAYERVTRKTAWTPDSVENLDMRERNNVDYLNRRPSYMKTQHADLPEWEDDVFEQLPPGTKTDNGQFVSRFQRLPEYRVHNTVVPGGEEAGLYPSATILQEINDVVHTSTDGFDRLPQSNHKFESDTDEWVDESDIEIEGADNEYIQDSESDEYTDDEEEDEAANDLMEEDEEDEEDFRESHYKTEEAKLQPVFPVNEKKPGPRIPPTDKPLKPVKTISSSATPAPGTNSSGNLNSEATPEADATNTPNASGKKGKGSTAPPPQTKRYRGLILRPGERYPFEPNFQGTYFTRLLLAAGARLCCETETEIATLVTSFERSVITATDWPVVPYKNHVDGRRRKKNLPAYNNYVY